MRNNIFLNAAKPPQKQNNEKLLTNRQSHLIHLEESPQTILPAFNKKYVTFQPIERRNSTNKHVTSNKFRTKILKY